MANGLEKNCGPLQEGEEGRPLSPSEARVTPSRKTVEPRRTDEL